MTARERLSICLLIGLAGRAQADAPFDNLDSPTKYAPVLTELGRKVVQHAGHTITYIRIRPPTLPVRPAPPVPLATESSAAPLSPGAEPEAKAYTHLSMSASVYIGDATIPTVTELTWWQDERRYHVWSNVDFRLLTALTELETAHQVYGWLPFVSEIPADDAPTSPPPLGRALFSVSDLAAEYVFVGTATEADAASATLDALDYLHAYYELHKTTLAAEHTRRIAAAAEHERRLLESPPRPKDSIIYFWKLPAGIASSTNSAP